MIATPEEIRSRYAPGPMTRLVRRLIGVINDQSIRGSGRLKAALGRWLPRKDVICHTIHGFDLIVKPREDQYQTKIYLNGTYEPATVLLMSRVLREGDIFLDVGANIGLMSLHAAALVGPSGAVFAFEPEPRIRTRLQENMALNGYANIRILPVALGDHGERREIFSFPEVNIGRGSLVWSEGAVAGDMVEVAKLDQIIQEQDIGNVRMMKVDVEGFELPVLRGAKRLLSGDFPPIICVEVSKDMPREGKEDTRALHEFIMSSGPYRCFSFKDKKSRASALVPMIDIATVPNNDNLTYIPEALLSGLPAEVFSRHRSAA